MDIWQIEAGSCREIDPAMFTALSDRERNRALAFHRQQDRVRFVVFHYSMRSILATYLGIGPQQVAFSYTRYNKPFLSASPPSLWFNLSHSDDIGLLAVSRRGDVGADIEHVQKLEDFPELSAGILSATQVNDFLGIPSPSRSLALTECWVRKEAYLKALGVGLEIEPQSIEVSIDPAVTTGPVRSSGRPDAWTYVSLQLPPFVRGAVCLYGNAEQLTYYKFPTSNACTDRAVK